MKLSAFSILPVLLGLVAAKISDLDYLAEIAADGKGVIALDERSFDMLVSPQRNWSASVQFTARAPSRRCGPCMEFDPSFQAVAKAWSKVSKEHRDQHFFGVVDYDDAPGIFNKLGMTSAPVVQMFRPAKGPRASHKAGAPPMTYDMSEGASPLAFAEATSKLTPIPIPYHEPVDYAKFGAMGSLAVSTAIALRFVAPIFRNKWLWAAGVITTSLVMTSGYMFVRIRDMPPAGGEGWIAGGYSNQYGREVYVISFIYGILGLSFVMLTSVVPRSPPARQRVQVYLWSGVILIFFSVLVSLFRIKNGGYPFKLLL